MINYLLLLVLVFIMNFINKKAEELTGIRIYTSIQEYIKNGQKLLYRDLTMDPLIKNVTKLCEFK